jgi:hypothetical protein
MVHMASAVAVGLLGLTSIVSAHPGHNHAAEAAERAAFVKSSSLQSRSLANCASTLQARGLESKNVARRQAAVKHLRRRRGINTRMYSFPYFSLEARKKVRRNHAWFNI